MIPATTPTFIITLKNAEGYLAATKKIRVDIKQQDVLIQKQINLLQTLQTEDITVDIQNNAIYIVLSQKESSKFLYKKGKIEIQIHGLLNDNTTAWKTYVVETSVERTLTREVIE